MTNNDLRHAIQIENHGNSRSTTVARTIVYVALGFSFFMLAEGIAHVSGRGDTALTTPAVAAVEQQQQRVAPAAIDLAGGGASYLPAIVRVQSSEELWNQPEMAPTF